MLCFAGNFSTQTLSLSKVLIGEGLYRASFTPEGHHDRSAQGEALFCIPFNSLGHAVNRSKCKNVRSKRGHTFPQALLATRAGLGYHEFNHPFSPICTKYTTPRALAQA